MYIALQYLVIGYSKQLNKKAEQLARLFKIQITKLSSRVAAARAPVAVRRLL